MKAMVIREFGGPEVFEEQTIGQPPIRPNDVLVKVKATSVNPVDVAESLGADLAIDYKSEDFVPLVEEATDGFGVDVVYDTVGGDTLARSLDVTKPFGLMVGIVSTDAGFSEAFRNNITIHTYFLEREHYKMGALRILAERGDLKPVIDSVMPFTEVAEAHRRLAAGGVRGKIVLSVDGDG